MSSRSGGNVGDELLPKTYTFTENDFDGRKSPSHRCFAQDYYSTENLISSIHTDVFHRIPFTEKHKFSEISRLIQGSKNVIMDHNTPERGRR